MTQKFDPNFDDALAALRREELDTATLNASGARVWNRMHQQMAEGAVEVEKIRGCDDVQALLPAYQAGTLAAARSLIVRDHLADCSACRHKARREVVPAAVWQQPAPVSSWGLRQFAMAAALLFVVGLTGYFGYNFYFAPVPGSRATVQSMEGAVYALNTSGERLLKVGDTLNEEDVVRSSGSAHAFLRLRDGSVVEMNERAEFRVSARRNDTTVNLERGNIIVQAAKRKTGHLYVRTNDASVSVTGTVFSVNSGMKGSRVSVIEGEVLVDSAGTESVLHSGDQVSTTTALGAVPVPDEIAWSRNLQQHLALLAEFSDLRKKLESVPMPRLRYESRILPLLPAGTIVYTSIPNYGEALAEANNIFQRQLQQSEVLRQWWERQGTRSGSGDFQHAIERLRQLSEYVGDELVFTLAKDGASQEPWPLMMAEIRRAGLKEFIEAEIAKTHDTDLVVLTPETLGAAVQTKGNAYLLVRPDFLIFSPSLRLLNHANGLAQAGGESFPSTEFGQRVSAVYDRGAGFFLAVNMDGITRKGVTPASQNAKQGQFLEATGFSDAKFLLVERKDVSGQSDTRALMEFRGERRGLASWLAAPAPMGSLEFVSPNASGAFSVVSKSPALMLDDMIRIIGTNPAEAGELSKVESRLGIRLREDLAATLGGDVTLALDGPVLPTPSWKLVAEVYDAGRLQSTIERLVEDANREMAARPEKGSLVLTSEQSNGRTFYELRPSVATPGANLATLHYTFSDGYLVVAASRALVVSALRTRESGNSLARSDSFRALLPNDTHTNCSGMAYQNLGPVLQPLMQYAPEGAERIRALAGDMKPSIVCAYGDPDRIQLASSGRLFGLDFNMLGLGTLMQNGEHRPSSSRKGH